MTKRRKYIILASAAIVAGGSIFFYFMNAGKKPAYDITAVSRGQIIQGVSVTGSVKPADSVDLAFEKGGRITKIFVKVGDRVSVNQILAILDNADLTAQLAQAQASLAVQQAKLEELRRGTRQEELQIAQTTVTNAQKTLADAQTSLESVKNEASASLQQVYEGSLSAAINSVAVGANSIYVLTDIQFAHFMDYTQIGSDIAEGKEKAVLALLGGADAGRWSNAAISQLSGGAKKSVQDAQNNPTYANIDKALSDVEGALEKIKAALDTVSVATTLTSTERTNLNTEKTNINAEIITVNGKQQTIEVQKFINSSGIATSEASLTTAKNTLAAAQAQLNLKLAGTAPEEIKAQEAQVLSAQANVASAQAQLAKTILRSPLNGIVTKQEAKTGEIIAANVVRVSLLSIAKFEIEANVSENEIAKINLGDPVEMTLDALGPAEKFTGRIIKINPAETIVSGVIYYKVTSVFDAENERIKSGMTVNLDIQTDKKESVLFLPYYTIKEKNGEKYVDILDNGQIKEQTIKTGLEGDTMVEITEGLAEGKKVVVTK